MHVTYKNMFKQIKILVLLVCLHVSFHYASEKAVAVVGIGTSAALAGAAAGFCKATYQETMTLRVAAAAGTGLMGAWYKQLISGREALCIGAITVAVAGFAYKTWRWNGTVRTKKDGIHYNFTTPFGISQQAKKAEIFFGNQQDKLCLVDDLIFQWKDGTTVEEQGQVRDKFIAWCYHLEGHQNAHSFWCENTREAAMQRVLDQLVKDVYNERWRPYIKYVTGNFYFVVNRYDTDPCGKGKPLKAGLEEVDVRRLFSVRATVDRLWNFFRVCIHHDNTNTNAFLKLCRDTLVAKQLLFSEQYPQYYQQFLQACTSLESFEGIYGKTGYGTVIKQPPIEVLTMLQSVLNELYDMYAIDIKLHAKHADI